MTSREEAEKELIEEMAVWWYPMKRTAVTSQAKMIDERLARREAEAKVKTQQETIERLEVENARLRRVFEIPHKEGER